VGGMSFSAKIWSKLKTNAADASIFLIFANVDPTKGYKGITCFVAEKEWGVEIAKKEKKVESIPLLYADCFVAWYQGVFNVPPSLGRPFHPERELAWSRRTGL